jgi:hypothetical protein
MVTHGCSQLGFQFLDTAVQLVKLVRSSYAPVTCGAGTVNKKYPINSKKKNQYVLSKMPFQMRATIYKESAV